MSDLVGSLDSSEWAGKIRMLREQKGWSQRDLAERLDLHPQSISEIERGKERLTLERLNRLLEALEYSSKVLVREEELSTYAGWGRIESDDPNRRRTIKNARVLAERLAEELYRRYEVRDVYCVGSLGRSHGRDFAEGSDVDLVATGLKRSDLIAAKSSLEIDVVESMDVDRKFSFDLQRGENFSGDPKEMVREDRAVLIPESEMMERAGG